MAKRVKANYRKAYIDLLDECDARESALQSQLNDIEKQLSKIRQISHNQLEQLWDKRSGRKLYK
jgi:hypothetical protein